MNDQEQENQRIHLICLHVFCSQELTLFREGYQIHSSKIQRDKITGEKKPAKILAVAFSDCEFTNCLWKQFFLTNVQWPKETTPLH